MSGARRSAKVLAVLSAADRQWILDQLNEHDRAGVEAELTSALRLPPSALVAEIAEVSKPRPKAVVVAAEPGDFDIVRRAPRERIVELVGGLPLIAIALLLDAERWPWAGDVTTSLRLERRKQLPGLALQAKATATDAVVPWLVGHLARRLKPAGQPGATDGGRFDAVFDTVSPSPSR